MGAHAGGGAQHLYNTQPRMQKKNQYVPDRAIGQRKTWLRIARFSATGDVPKGN
jgi:hypothetical protein